MFALVITVHVLACILLILIVLIQQGKGGGLIDSMSSAESIFGTKTNTFLVKSTSVLAVVFFITCLSLAFFSIQKSKSLIETYRPTGKNTAAKSLIPTAQTPQEKTVPAQPEQNKSVQPVVIPATTQNIPPASTPPAPQTQPNDQKTQNTPNQVEKK